ncbi:hypothetical protein WBG99_18245 [Streptomyces sp. TG1A-60]
MGDALVGACSWTDRALLASGWYPRGGRLAPASWPQPPASGVLTLVPP